MTTFAIYSGPLYFHPLLWMDEIHFATPKQPWLTPLSVGVYRRINIPGLLRWCRISSIHSTVWMPFGHPFQNQKQTNTHPALRLNNPHGRLPKTNIASVNLERIGDPQPPQRCARLMAIFLGCFLPLTVSHDMDIMQCAQEEILRDVEAETHNLARTFLVVWGGWPASFRVFVMLAHAQSFLEGIVGDIRHSFWS